MWRVSQNVSRRFCSLQPGWEHETRVLLCQSRLYSNQKPITDAKNPQTNNKPAEPKAVPPPPPPPPKKSGLFFKLLGLVIAGTGGVVGYAWYDKGFRTKLEGIHPHMKEPLDLLFTYLPATEKSEENIQLPGMAGNLELQKHSLQEKRALTSIEESKEVQTKNENIKLSKGEIERNRKEEEKLKKEEERKNEEERKLKVKREAAQKLLEQEMEDAAENAALENILQLMLVDAERHVKLAIELQHTAISTTRDHTDKLREAMDLQGQDKEDQWEAATLAFAAKSATLTEAEDAAEAARLELEKIQVAVSEGKAHKVTKKNRAIVETERAVNTLNYDLKAAIGQSARAQSEARVMADYRNLVKKGREQFRKEVESLTPEVLLNKKGGKLTEEELNSLIAHAHRRIEQLQRQLAEQQALEEVRINAALDKQREEDEKLADGRVEREQEYLQAQFELLKYKWEMDSQVNFERELRHQLSRQAAAHSDHLADVLKVQESQLEAKFTVQLEEHLTKERLNFQTEVAGWIARLKGIETAVEGRAELEQQGRKAQELWLACQMLHNIIEFGPDVPEDGEDDSHYETRIKPLMDEFIAVLDAGDDHPYVNCILETIPDEAVKRGIWTEKELSERFNKVHKMCRRVAMIDETGATLFRYFLSYLQSWFVFSSAKPFMETEKIDISELNTFSILDNARYHLEHGNLESALRFMNQLSGEPRNVASDWIKEARLLLETQQAADALVAHASSRGLGSLY